MIKRTKIFPLLLVGIFFVYLVMSSSAINEKQMVYGDMQTQYISKRVSQGLILYEDISILYGPVIYHIGAFFLGLGTSYAGLKIVMLVVAVVSGILVYLISNKVFDDKRIGVLATAIFMFLPIHYGVAPVFHPDSFAVLFALASLYLLLTNRNIGIVTAGIFAVFAIFTKIPVAPLIIAPMIFFLIRKEKSGLFYFVPFLVLFLVGTMYINSLDESNDNTEFILEFLFSNPDPPYEMLKDLMWIEGFVILVAIVGIIIYLKKEKKKSLLIFFAFSSPLAFAAILIRGVGIYEANYMEPFIAIFASYAIFYLKDRWVFKRGKKILPFLLIMLIFVQITIFVWPDRERVADWDGNRWAKQANEIAEEHSNLLEKYSQKGDVVVASPMAATITDRTMPLENSYIEMTKLKHEADYQSAKDELSILMDLIENKEIKMLISYNSTKRNDPKYNNFQEKRFFPFYTKPFSDLLFQNYEKFEENGFYYYLPKGG